MSSALQSPLSALQQNNYGSFAALIAVGYDYVLVFPQEVEYIWGKPWSRVSTLFIFVRYCGLINLACAYALCQILGDIEYWAYVLFLVAADSVMILRVWAMYHRSRTILGVLFTLFSIEIISMTVALAVYINSKSEQGLGYSFCLGRVTSPIFQDVSNILQISFAAVLCILAIVQFIRQSLQMYDATKQWQPGRYINFLLQQGILYFFVIFLLNLIDLLDNTGRIPGTGWQYILTCILADVPAYTLTPRFIISIRDMYANDVQGRSGGGFDSGLGLSTLPNHGGAAGESIEFVDGVQNDVTENVREDDVQDEGRGNIEVGQNEGREDIELVLPSWGLQVGSAY